MAKSLHDPRYIRLIDLLIDARHAADLTQRDLADRLKRAQSYVAKIETRQRRLDALELIEVLVALKVDVAGFMTSYQADLRKRR